MTARERLDVEEGEELGRLEELVRGDIACGQFILVGNRAMGLGSMEARSGVQYL